MIISTKVLRTSLFAGLGTAFITVIGMLTVFAQRYVIADLLTLSLTMLAVIYLAVGVLASRQLPAASRGVQALNGVLAALIVIGITIAATLVLNQANMWITGLGSETAFPNVNSELLEILSLGQANAATGYLYQALIAAALGALGAIAVGLPKQVTGTAQTIALAILVMGLLQDQIRSLIALPDALWLVTAVIAGYLVARWRNRARLGIRILEATLVAALLGLVFGGVLLLLGANSTSLPAVFGRPAILSSVVLGHDVTGMLALIGFLSAALGATGAVLSSAQANYHSIGLLVLTGGVMLGILSVTGKMTLLIAIVIALVMIASQQFSRRMAPIATARYEGFNPAERQTSRTLLTIVSLVFALVLPSFLTGYFNNVLDLIGLYVMMGLGLNIVVGFAGLLDLGYVAFFAIGAYTVGILTTPNALTCGPGFAELAANQIQSSCTLLTFWTAWPIAVMASGLAGVLLGIPVLRLRGDYLAIVTLGFGEIIRLLALSDVGKPYFGGAQGIVSIPSPIIDLSGIATPLASSSIPLFSRLGTSLAAPIALSQPNQIYYLILFGVLLTAFITNRLSHSRLGRSWRAMKEDESVAQAMGINLVRTKLLAFSIGAAFAGLGGALFGSYLKSIFPNSFTLQVSINVLSLIIIGGLGSIPGVFVGALMIFGLPEALREFEEFRLLLFGALLVITMLLRPEGMLPPSSAQLEAKAEKALVEEGA